MRRYKHWRILGTLESQFQMSRSPLAIHLDLNDISNVKILSQLFHTLFFLYNPRDSNVEWTIDPVFLIVFNEGLNHSAILNLSVILNMSIYKCIFLTISCISHDLLKDSQLLVVLLSVLIKLMHQFHRSVLFLQFLINHGQVYNILSSVVNHILCKWSSFPEHVVIAHLEADLMLLRVYHVNVVLQQVGKRNVIIFKILKLRKLAESLLHHAMCYLCIEDIVTVQIVLIYEGRLVFAKVMKYLYYRLRFHHFPQTMNEGIYCEKIE
jgi:hypothetical protein